MKSNREWLTFNKVPYLVEVKLKKVKVKNNGNSVKAFAKIIQQKVI